ncbi:RNA polymerase ECF-type sigma factor [Salisediminibacterium beveridgei]|uniref:RNA polymerase ECF-type sigma factor n=1 Tax=Salisediminibacterium beveridgei TaxID=632773 RepID=A0A1D7QZ15_9BACI|nr:RNA polymerase ECF-type sigma factor [Salisediminibacterium beveridgei]
MSFKEQLAGGDEEALSALMDTYGSVLMRTAILLVKDRQLAEEVVQDTFVTAYKKIHQLESDDKLKGWLVTITVNGCRSRMRTWIWRNLYTAKDEDVFQDMEETSLLPEAQLLTAIENEELHEAVQSLPYNYREPIALFLFSRHDPAGTGGHAGSEGEHHKNPPDPGTNAIKRSFDERSDCR